MNDNDFQQILRRVQKSKSEATAGQYIPKIRDFRGWLDRPFEEADVFDVEDWLEELDDKYNNSSSVGKGEAALIAAYEELDRLITRGRIEGDNSGWERGRNTPPKRAEPSLQTTDTYKARKSKKNLHYLEPEQVKAMADETERLRDNLIIRLLFQTGCRATEVAEIRLSDIDLEAREIHVRGKGSKNRLVCFQDSVKFLLDTWVNERRPAIYYAEDSPYLFPTSHSENIKSDALGTIVKDAAERADLQEVYGKNTDGQSLNSITCHTLRHSFAMAALSNGWDVFTLSQALGHESAETTTNTYLHRDDKQVRRAFQERGPATVGTG